MSLTLAILKPDAVGSGNGDVTVRILPGADHTFRLAAGASGWPVTAPDYVSSLLAWLAQR